MLTLRNVRLRRLAVVALATCAALACGDSKPSEKAGEQALRVRIDDGGEQRLKLQSFKKVDGQAAEAMGVKMYTMMFAAEAEFVANAAFSAGAPLSAEGDHITTKAPPPPTQGFSWDNFLAGSQGFHPAAAGDKLRLTGRVTFEQRESGWNATDVSLRYSLDSSGRGGASQSGAASGGAAAGERLATGGSPDTTSTSGRRCAEFATAHPPPKQSIIDRVRGRSVGIAATLPDSDFRITLRGEAPPGEPGWRLENVGQIAYLPSGEVCIGATLVLAVGQMTKHREYYNLSLSKPISSKGYRMLSVNEIDNGVTYAWVVHPDSLHALSGDLLADFHVYPDGKPAPGISQLRFSLPGYWSPDDRFLLLSAGSWVRHGLLVVDLRDRSSHFISAAGFLPPTSKNNCWVEHLATDSLKWTAPDVVQVPLSYSYSSEGGENPEESCPKPWEMSATLVIDLSQRSASRLR